MARSRNIKPTFFTNGDLLECQPLARLLFAGLWTEADCRGILEDRPKNLKIRLLPGDNCDVDELLNELERAGFITRYQVGAVRCIFVKSFGKHQNPHQNEKPNPLPAPEVAADFDSPAPESIVEVDSETPEDSGASTRVAPEQHQSDPADSFNLIPDSLKPSPDGDRRAPDLITSRRARRGPKVPIPDDFAMSESTVEWCRERGYSRRLVDQELERFKLSAEANDRRYANWQAAFQSWLKKCETDGWGQVKETSNWAPVP